MSLVHSNLVAVQSVEEPSDNYLLGLQHGIRNLGADLNPRTQTTAELELGLGLDIYIGARQNIPRLCLSRGHLVVVTTTFLSDRY